MHGRNYFEAKLLVCIETNYLFAMVIDIDSTIQHDHVKLHIDQLGFIHASMSTIAILC